MKILVAGGAGFIGSHLCRKLLEQGNSVLCIDNLYTGSMNNINDLIEKEHFKFVHHDVTEHMEYDAEQIYNLACPASPVHYQKNPVKTFETSVLGVMQLLRLANKNNAVILQASTSEVYGDPFVHPQKESYWGNVNPIGFRSCYDEGKRAAETLFFDYHRQYGTKIKVARIFNTYGANMQMNDGRVVSNFIVQALKNKDITIYGDGSQTRSFCYVSDMVDGLIALMNSSPEFTGPVNLGNPCETDMKLLAEIILKMTGSDSSITYHALPLDDPHMRKPDITLAKSGLNWTPVVKLEDGLKETIAYFLGLVGK